MSEENEDTGHECVMDALSDDPTRYKRMLDLLRDAGADHAWTSSVPTGELACWTIGRSVVLVQRLGDSVEVYTNSETPSTWEGLAVWLETL
jgi:hypothetical protein